VLPAIATVLAIAQSGPVFPRTRTVNGVVIREHDAGAFARAPSVQVDPTPIATAGGPDGHPDYDLTYAGSALFFRDGRFATLSRVGNLLFIFGANGTPQRQIGRQGNGPGEFMAPTDLIPLQADTFLFGDEPNGRFNWVLPDRGIIRDSLVPSAFGVSVHRLAGMLPRGTLVMHSGGLVSNVATDVPSRPPAKVYATTLGGAAPKLVAELPDLDLVLRETRFRGRVLKSPAVLGFTRRALVAVWDTLIATAGSDSGYRIQARNPDGRVVSEIRVAITRRPVTKAMRDAFIAQSLKRFEQRSGEGGYVDIEESKRLERERPFADSLPFSSNIFVSPNKTLWVIDAPATNDTAWTATAFRLDGAIIGRLRVPGQSTPLAFGNDRVLVRDTDADGVVTLRVYRLRPS
jgi:hypothetical protein